MTGLEDQINLMAAMMAEMKSMMTAQGKAPAAPEVNPTTSNDSDTNQTTGTESEKDVPHKTPPFVIDLEI